MLVDSWMLDTRVNHFAVVIAALIYYILGAIWYSPKLFGEHWMKHEGLTPSEPKKSMVLAFIGEFILDLVIAYVLAALFGLLDVLEVQEGIIIAFWIWLGFLATTHFSAVLWGKKTFAHYLIHAGFMLLGLVLMAIVLVYLRSTNPFA